MSTSITSVTLVVHDYDEAIKFFRDALRFRLIEDEPLGGGKRWVRMAPAESRGASLLLARAVTPEQLERVGNQTGGRVSFFLGTDDFWGDYAYMKAHGVQFVEQPRQESYGMVVVFLDLYGNRWDLVQQDTP